MKSPLISLGLFVLVSFLPTLGAIGSSPGEWYAALRKPLVNPPGWVFGPVWTILYLLMGISAWLVWRKAGPGQRLLPMAVFGAQLILNGLWSIVFFRWHRPDLALANLAGLWVGILAMILTFRRIEPIAAHLQIPYLLWVSFAGYLNLSIWLNNR